MYLNNCTSVGYMRKRINYETSNNAIITLDPIEIFIYVIMIVCGRLRNPDNNFLLMYTRGSSSLVLGISEETESIHFNVTCMRVYVRSLPLDRIWQKACGRFVRHYVWAI